MYMDNALNEYSHAQRGDGILRRMNVYMHHALKVHSMVNKYINNCDKRTYT